jgi:hypothetical protein
MPVASAASHAARSDMGTEEVFVRQESSKLLRGNRLEFGLRPLRQLLDRVQSQQIVHE